MLEIGYRNIGQFFYIDDAGVMRWKRAVSKIQPVGSPVSKLARVVNRNQDYKVAYRGSYYSLAGLSWMLHTGKPVPERFIVAHIDGDLDNARFSNLQLVFDKRGHSNFRGVKRVAARGGWAWRPTIMVDLKPVGLGVWDDEEDAAACFELAYVLLCDLSVYTPPPYLSQLPPPPETFFYSAGWRFIRDYVLSGKGHGYEGHKYGGNGYGGFNSRY